MKNHAFNAVLSRVDQYELIGIQRGSAGDDAATGGEGFEGLTPDECQEVVDFIAEFSATRELSLRLLEPSLRKVLYARESRGGLAAARRLPAPRNRRTAVPKVSDARTYDMECLRQVVEDYPDSVADQEAAFRAMTSAFQGDVLPAEEGIGEARHADRGGKGTGRVPGKLYYGRRDQDISHMITAIAEYFSTTLEER